MVRQNFYWFLHRWFHRCNNKQDKRPFAETDGKVISINVRYIITRLRILYLNKKNVKKKIVRSVKEFKNIRLISISCDQLKHFYTDFYYLRHFSIATGQMYF